MRQEDREKRAIGWTLMVEEEWFLDTSFRVPGTKLGVTSSIVWMSNWGFRKFTSHSSNLVVINSIIEKNYATQKNHPAHHLPIPRPNPPIQQSAKPPPSITNHRELQSEELCHDTPPRKTSQLAISQFLHPILQAYNYQGHYPASVAIEGQSQRDFVALREECANQRRAIMIDYRLIYPCPLGVRVRRSAGNTLLMAHEYPWGLGSKSCGWRALMIVLRKPLHAAFQTPAFHPASYRDEEWTKADSSERRRTV
ncbi:hypothetical protein KM043_001190 [Ampulex compressa]|nr:hypothetical protein KM043_001190 [Ampulex compressa]